MSYNWDIFNKEWLVPYPTPQGSQAAQSFGDGHCLSAPGLCSPCSPAFLGCFAPNWVEAKARLIHPDLQKDPKATFQWPETKLLQNELKKIKIKTQIPAEKPSIAQAKQPHGIGYSTPAAPGAGICWYRGAVTLGQAGQGTVLGAVGLALPQRVLGGFPVTPLHLLLSSGQRTASSPSQAAQAFDIVMSSPVMT